MADYQSTHTGAEIDAAVDNIKNVDLSAAGFTPVANTYYKHTGTTAAFIKGVIYYYNGTDYKALNGAGGVTGVYIAPPRPDYEPRNIVVDGVAIIPIADGTNPGVVRYEAFYGWQIFNGTAYGVTKSYASYNAFANDGIISKGTLENVLDNETVRVDKAQSLTDSQKAQAKANLGVGYKYLHCVRLTGGSEVVALYFKDNTPTPYTGFTVDFCNAMVGAQMMGGLDGEHGVITNYTRTGTDAQPDVTIYYYKLGYGQDVSGIIDYFEYSGDPELYTITDIVKTL